MTVDSHTLHIS